MSDPQPRWNRFQRLKVRPSLFSERARRAESATMKHANRFLVERLHNAREARRSIALWLLGVGVLIAASAVQFMLFQQSYVTYADAAGGTYAEGTSGTLGTLNPLYAATPAELSVSHLLFSSLFNYDETGSLRGDLAKSYSVEDSGKVYHVVLRKDAKWHDGKPVTAKDIVFTINLIKKPAAGSSLNASWQDIDIKQTGEYELDFILPAAYAPFANAMTFPVLPQHILANVNPSELRDSEFSKKPVGSGPFSYRFTQLVNGSTAHTVVLMNRNDSYYAGAPKIERFQLHAYESSDELNQGLRSHAINAASGVSLGSMSLFTKDPQFVATTKPVNAGVYALFNTKSIGALSDEKVRQALQRGTDVKQALKDLPSSTKQIDTPFIDSQVDLGDVKKPAYSIKEAEQLLEDAGWKRSVSGVRTKADQPLVIKVVAIKDADYESLLGNLAKQWRALGVRVETRTVDTNDPAQNIASSILQPRDFDVLIHELTIGADPDVYAYWHSSQAVARGLNFTNYSSGVSDDALASARSRTEPELRQAKYKTFARQWLKDAPAIGLYQSNMTYVQTKGTSAFDSDATLVSSLDRYSNIQYWTTHQEPVYKTP